MALEVISKTSFHKDAKVLRELYWQAGIAEYWLVDARRDPVEFKLLRRTARGYAAVRPVESWVKSAVFGKEFRLVRGVDPIGEPEYTLEVRS
jgi:Uma2 family endonuclease